MIELKTCSRCHNELSSTEFNRDIRSADGLQGYCKKCIMEYHKEYKLNHPKPIKPPRKINNKSRIRGTVSRVYRDIIKREYWQCIINLSDRKLASNKITYDDIPQLIREEYHFMLLGYSFI